MEQTGSSHQWKTIIIVLLALALLALLVWIFLRPVEPARHLVFGDLGLRAVPSNAAPTGPVESAPQPPPNLLSNAGPETTNFPLTNEPGRDLNEQSAPRREPPLTGQGSVLADSGSNSAGTNLSSNEVPASGSSSSSLPPSGQTPVTPSNSETLPPPRPPPPPASNSSPQSTHTRWVPDADAWPPDSLNKDTTAKLLAQAKAANMARLNPIPARTADLLGYDGHPWRIFDAEAGSNVVFMVDNSMSMMTNGKSFSARQEVMRTLLSMRAGKSFYVLFFHAGGYEGMPSLAPLPASPENVRAITNWLFSVGHRTGADPTKAMLRALGLVPAPDTVWLLSGSPLTEQVVDNIREANASANAHINTIGFYTRDGEQALGRIADENRGVYRYVPPPNIFPP